jgi:hypothetical protein
MEASGQPAANLAKTKTGFAGQFLVWLSERFCQHNFSWPQTGPQGRDYQTCVLCGAAYEYDWVTMRRTHRLADPGEAQANPWPAR